MRTFYFTLFISCITFFSFSQNGVFECATPDDTNADPPGVHSYSTDASIYLSAEPLVLNVKFWKVNGPNGEFYGDFTENHPLEGIAALNMVFNQFNIFFKYRGWEAFNSPNDVIDKRYEDGDGDGDYECIMYPNPDPDGYTKLDRCQLGYFWSFVGNNYSNTSDISIYITSWNVTFGGAAQHIVANKIVIGSGSLIDDTALIHEMAHALGLYHMRSSWEHVTRDPNNPNYNASSSGDRVVDTAANPGFWDYPNCMSGSDPACYPYITPDCEYDENSPETDNVGDPYALEIDHLDVINILSNAYLCTEKYLSPGQGIRMREKIQNYSVLQATLTDVPALYEPYSGEYYFAGPFDPAIHTPLLQPGFNYRFVECSGSYPQPADYYDLSFSYNLNSVLLGFYEDEIHYENITHPNHSAIWIAEIDDASTDANNLDKPRKCYNNWNRKPSGGSITRFNDGVLNTNVTIIPQDSTAINNPNIIQNLDTGLYKIEKIYNDGAVQQTVLQKGTN